MSLHHPLPTGTLVRFTYCFEELQGRVLEAEDDGAGDYVYWVELDDGDSTCINDFEVDAAYLPVMRWISG